MAILGRVLGFCLFFGLGTAAGQAESPATVDHVLSGEEFVLTNGQTVRLEGLKAPLPEARVFLEQALTGKDVSLENSATDRYDDATAQVEAGADWIQGEMLARGLAFVYPPTGEESRLTAMLAAERAARKAGLGLWHDPAFADLDPDHVPDGRFAFVRGTVVKAERIKNKVYLNFGDNWHTDFTISIAAHDLRLFRKAGIDPLTYQGQTIRVRGWVHREFGPMINVTSPMQIERE